MASSLAETPAGTNSEARLGTPTTSNSLHFVRPLLLNLATNTQYTYQFIAKANGYDNIIIELAANHGVASNPNVNLTTGAVTSAAGTTTTATSLGNGWWRVVCTFTTGGTVSTTSGPSVFINIYGNFVGDGISGAWFGAFQLERGATATSLIPTTNGPVSVLQPRGLLVEGARTNLALQSADWSNAAWAKNDTTPTANSIASPDGGTNAALLTEGTLGTADVSQIVTITAGSNHTDSVFVKRGNTDWLRIEAVETTATNGARTFINTATGALGTTSNIGTGTGAAAKVTSYPNGWYRVELTTTVAAAVTARLRVMSATADASTTRVNNATYYAWGGQIEQHSFATSYFPTTGASATRAAETPRINNLANISFNPTAFTILCEIDGRNLGGAGSLAAIPWSFRDNPETSSIRPYLGTVGGTMGLYAITGGVLQYNSPIPGSQDARGQATYRLAVTAGPLGLRTAAKGSSVVSNVSPSYLMGTFTVFEIGQTTGASHLNAHVRSLIVQPGELSSAEILTYVNGA
jgi:hypothetical protein